MADILKSNALHSPEYRAQQGHCSSFSASTLLSWASQQLQCVIQEVTFPSKAPLTESISPNINQLAQGVWVVRIWTCSYSNTSFFRLRLCSCLLFFARFWRTLVMKSVHWISRSHTFFKYVMYLHNHGAIDCVRNFKRGIRLQAFYVC